MKLSKNLLQAMTVGLALGATTAAVSCSSLQEETNVKPQPEMQCCTDGSEKCTHGETIDLGEDCPACGLG